MLSLFRPLMEIFLSLATIVLLGKWVFASNANALSISPLGQRSSAVPYSYLPFLGLVVRRNERPKGAISLSIFVLGLVRTQGVYVQGHIFKSTS